MNQEGSLSIIIPIWNELEGIPLLFENVEAEKRAITKAEPWIKDVEVIVVDDGSTDGSTKILSEIRGITLLKIRHSGYGAALKEGFKEAKGEILGFMDGDNTCDMKCFSHLCRQMLSRNVHMVNGNRLHRKSSMSFERYCFNRTVGLILSFLSGKKIDDVCSGMRVFSRQLMPMINNLPDDLSFSPALSAQVLFSNKFLFSENRIEYGKRVGNSKISLISDTYRFIKQVFIAYKKNQK
jgi:glycosyltransferase involved in cell wall biosynthesis